jgi:putative glutamine amidotransferase
MPEKVPNYIAALREVNAEPVAGLEIDDISPYDRLILPGGGDVDPSFYGQAINGSAYIDIELDRLQFSILDKFVKSGKPVLGICRGQQVINVYFGGSLIQHLATAEKHVALNTSDNVHDSITNEDSYLTAIYGTSFSVNSSHHQAVDRLGQGLSAVQYSPDGVIEAVVHERKPVIGVQWHPERMTGAYSSPVFADGLLIFEFFLGFR